MNDESSGLICSFCSFVQLEAIPESLKNMLLVMDTAGIFHSADSRTGFSDLWEITWERIICFLPHLREELFKQAVIPGRHGNWRSASKLCMFQTTSSYFLCLDPVPSLPAEPTPQPGRPPSPPASPLPAQQPSQVSETPTPSMPAPPQEPQPASANGKTREHTHTSSTFIDSFILFYTHY